MALDARPELGQQALGDRPGGHPGRRLPGAGALQDVPGIGPVVLQHAHQVRVARTGEVHAPQRLVVRLRSGLDGHRHPPVLEVPIPEPHGQGGAERLAQPHAAQDLARVLLDRHPAAPAMSPLPARQLGGDLLGKKREPGGHALDDHEPALAVRLPGGGEAEMVQHRPPDESSRKKTRWSAGPRRRTHEKGPATSAGPMYGSPGKGEKPSGSLLPGPRIVRAGAAPERA